MVSFLNFCLLKYICYCNCHEIKNFVQVKFENFHLNNIFYCSSESERRKVKLRKLTVRSYHYNTNRLAALVGYVHDFKKIVFNKLKNCELIAHN